MGVGGNLVRLPGQNALNETWVHRALTKPRETQEYNRIGSKQCSDLVLASGISVSEEPLYQEDPAIEQKTQQIALTDESLGADLPQAWMGEDDSIETQRAQNCAAENTFSLSVLPGVV